jgi:hypothetical protein
MVEEASHRRQSNGTTKRSQAELSIGASTMDQHAKSCVLLRPGPAAGELNQRIAMREWRGVAKIDVSTRQSSFQVSLLAMTKDMCIMTFSRYFLQGRT